MWYQMSFMQHLSVVYIVIRVNLITTDFNIPHHAACRRCTCSVIGLSLYIYVLLERNWLETVVLLM